MKRGLMALALLGAAFAAQPTVTLAQSADIPGGASGTNVFCLQAGDLKSGAFVGTYLQTGTGGWEERLKAGTFKLGERKRDDLTVELFDTTRSASVQFDFVNRTVKYRAGSGNANWTDRYYILNATDKAGSTDCAALASLSAPGGGGAGAGGPGAGPGAGGGGSGAGGGRNASGPNRSGGGGGGGGGPNASQPTHPTNVFVLPPGTKLDIPPGTRFTALQGPPCPGQPGMFLCPNKFSCAPAGGVCCPGAGSCNAGLFCDAFVQGACVAPGDARFCPGTGNVVTGTSLHCAPGLACISGNQCQ